MATRVEMQTMVRNYLGQLGTSYVTSTAIIDALNRSGRRLNRECRIYQADKVVGLTAGNREVSMGASVMEIYRVRTGTGTDRKRITPTSYGELDLTNADWESATAGEPLEYYRAGQYIGFIPRPPDANTYATSTRYIAGQYIVPTTDNGHIYKCTVTGTTSTTEPTWPTSDNATVTAGTVTFQECGPSKAYIRAHYSVPDLANATSVPTWLPYEFHDTQAKGAAIDIAGGFSSGTENNPIRHTALYQEYLVEHLQLKSLYERTSMEHTPQIRVQGYGSYRRR